jgi:uncharacterized hydrophobic protein (TIGR00271 family)
MLQIRVISPPDLTPVVLERLEGEHGTASVTVHLGSALAPEGDLLIVEVARERGNAVVNTLTELEVDERGAISLIALEAHSSRRGRAAELAAAGRGVDALLWQELEEHATDDARGSVTYVVMMILAALLAAMGIVLDSSVLVIGAMIVGPEYAPLTALAVSIYRRRRDTLTASLTLFGGLLIGVVAAMALAAILRATGEIGAHFDTSTNAFTSFVSDPNIYSFLVAFIAGIAGTIALAQGRQGVLAGVLVSVTTIPAAAAMGINVVVANWSGTVDALALLALNISALLLASLSTLWVHDRAWRRVSPIPTTPPPPPR